MDTLKPDLMENPMSQNFQPGTKVRCIDDSSAPFLLKEGEVYTVSGDPTSVSELIYVEEIDEPVLRHRFERVEETTETFEERLERYQKAFREGVAQIVDLAEAFNRYSTAPPNEQSIRNSVADFMQQAVDETTEAPTHDVDPDVNEYIRRYEEYGYPIRTTNVHFGPVADITDLLATALQSEDLDEFVALLTNLRNHAMAQYEVERDRFEAEKQDLTPKPVDLVEELHEAIHGESWARPESPKEVWEELLQVVREQAKRIEFQKDEIGRLRERVDLLSR